MLNVPKIYNISSQIWDDTDNNCIIYIIILFLFSLFSSQISLFLSSRLYLLSHLCLLYSSSIARRSPMATTRRLRPFVFSIPLQVLLFFLFSFFCSCFLAVVWWVGWAMSGFRWADQWWVGSVVMAMGGLSFMGCGIWQWVGYDG